MIHKDRSTMLARDPLQVTCFAQAFTGEVLGNTSAVWNVNVSSGSYSPVNMSAYSFGTSSGGDGESYSRVSEKNYSGKHSITVSLDHITTSVVVNVRCTIKVQTIIAFFLFLTFK